MESRGVRRELVGGVLWALLGTIFAQGSVFLSSIVAARILGRAEFGKLALLQSSVAMLGGFATMGLNVTATKFVAELQRPAPDRVGRILGLCTIATAATGTLFAAGLIVVAPWASVMFRVGGLEQHLRLGSIYVLFFTLNSYQVGALTGFGAFSRLARIGLVQGIVGVSLMALGTWCLGLTGAVLALGAAAVCSWIQHQVALRGECRTHGVRIAYSGYSGQEFGILSGFAAPAALSGCVGGIAVVAANTLLVRQPGGVREMATFTAANTIRIIVLFVPGLVSRVSSPLLCRLQGSGNRATFVQTWRNYLVVNSLMAAGAAMILFAAGPLLLHLYGREFVEGRSALTLLLVAAVTETVAVALFQTLYTHGKLWTQFGIASIWSALLVGATWQWAANHGAAGLAAGYLLAWGVELALYAVVARRLLAHEPAMAAAGLRQ